MEQKDNVMMKYNKNITLKEVRKYFQYDHKTGRFFRTKTKKLENPSKNNGWIRKDGYIIITFDYRRFFAHRLIWLWYYGEWPKYRIDHINGNTRDNRICNLRDVTIAKNARNQKRHREKDKTIGAYFVQHINKWNAKITIDGKTKNLGYFASRKEANSAYFKAWEASWK